MNNENVMMMRRAKQQLAGQWGNAAIATVIYLVIMVAAGSVYLGALILDGPLTFGYVLFLSCLIDTRSNCLDLLFSGFNRFMQTLVAGLLVSIVISVGLVFLIVPGIIATTGLALTFFIMADDQNIQGTEAIKMSWEMMDGHKMELFCLWLRFFGWFLLASLTCGIGYIWLYPYITATTLNYYRRLRYGTY